MSATSAITSAMQLLQSLELGTTLLGVLFTVCDVDKAIRERRKQPPLTPTFVVSERSIGFGFNSLEELPSIRRSAGETRPVFSVNQFVQDQAESLKKSLDAVLTAFPGTLLSVGADQIFEQGLVYLLALAIWEQAAVDDHIAALAVQDGEDLPAITRCQGLVQDSKFQTLVEEGIDGLGGGEEEEEGIDSGKMIQRVVNSIVKQADIDANREMFALRNGQPLPDTTACQQVIGHPLYTALFSQAEKAYYDDLNSKKETKIQIPEVADSKGKQKTPSTVECTGCCDTVNENDCLEATCGHSFCPGCISMLVGASIKDEAYFPPKCCRISLELEILTLHLDSDPALLKLFQAISFEYGTPINERIYCPGVNCSSFLGPKGKNSTMECSKCDISVCTSCKNRAHPGDNCEQSKLLDQVKELAEKEKWRQCPWCHTIVERTDGCNHMVCRCTKEFCYTCGVPWRPRTCSC